MNLTISNILERIFEPWGKWELEEVNVKYIYTQCNIFECRSYPVFCDVYKRVHKFNGSVEYKKIIK